jgi:hypothetical protein
MEGYQVNHVGNYNGMSVLHYFRNVTTCCGNPCHEFNPGIDYYISNSGSALNDGLTPATPKDPASISDFDLTRKANLCFAKGETFNPAITLSNIGIGVCAYGTGALPIFYGSLDISNLVWTNEGNGTYSTPMTEPNMIYINGLRAKRSETAWITITSYPATDKFGINNANVSAYQNIVGSKVIVLLRPWTTEYLYTVTDYTASVITLNQATNTQTSVVGETFKLLGKKDYPMVNNGWAWQDGVLYIKTTVSPSTMDIRMSVSNVGVTVSDGANNATIKDIDFRDYYYSAVKRFSADDIIVENCTIRNSSGYPVAMVGMANNMTVKLNTIYNCDGGIYDRSTLFSYVQYNEIYNIGMGATLGSIVDYDLVAAPNKAIFIRDNYSTPPNMVHAGGDISYNKVYNIASTGIQIQGNMNCHHNIVHDFMQLFSDGGGIYAYANAGYTTVGSRIYKNIVYNGGSDACSGIYADNRCIYFDIYDNVIYNIPSMAGININWDKQFTSCRNNILVDCLFCIRYTQGGVYTAWAINQGNVSTGNIFALRSASQYCHKAEVNDSTVNYNPFNNGGLSNNNYYISPYINRVGFHTDNNSMTLGSMRSRYTSDAQSTQRVNYKTYVDQVQAEIDVLLLTNETDTPIVQSVGSGYIDIDGNSITSVTVPAYGGFLALKS